MSDIIRRRYTCRTRDQERGRIWAESLEWERTRIASFRKHWARDDNFPHSLTVWVRSAAKRRYLTNCRKVGL